MTLSWAEAERSPLNTSPYVDWWTRHEGADSQEKFVSRAFMERPEQNAHSVKEYSRRAIENLYTQAVPIPAHAAKPEGPADPWSVGQIVDNLPCDLPENTVLTGVVDTGIALAHRRSRRSEGSSRIVAAWQQTASHGGQSFLPFGQELYSKDIERLIKDHTHDGSLLGRLDEDAFVRTARLIEPHESLGHRDLEFHAAHGTHVLDLASGFDARCTPDSTLASNRIIAVNLPPRSLHGSAGNFLALWAIFAMERIFHIADALWEANRAAHGNVPEGGYPLVVNFSYGMQAGPKTGDSSLELGIQALLRERQEKYAAPTRIVMPAGNENVDRGHARALMGTGKWRNYELMSELAVPWRILPADHTSNFVEIWNSALPPDEHTEAEQPSSTAFKLFVSPPGYDDLEVPLLQRGYHSNLDDIARVYCQIQGERVSFVLAVAPTASHLPDGTLAPAGAWRIRLEYHGSVVNADMYVQSDQSTMPGSRTGRKSYFDHLEAIAFSEDGRPRDSYDYDSGDATDSWLEFGPVQIKGSQNALATSVHVNVVGGYRTSDGKPEIYSSTNDGVSKQNGLGREILDASYPSEDAPSLFGLLAAGSRDGSVVAYRGTSMATGLATRDIATALAEWDPKSSDPRIGDYLWLRNKADAYLTSADRPAQYRRPRKLKAGVGQLPYPGPARSGRVPRS
ncbi:hypothetical protein [Yoonia sp. R2-816]|uniref:hypothetical protein n=1 Tax=Yoonia sp. R2-816 TaxID=3342638 RepID=UPI00372848E9